jgi:hypothetical protein
MYDNSWLHSVIKRTTGSDLRESAHFIVKSLLVTCSSNRAERRGLQNHISLNDHNQFSKTPQLAEIAEALTSHMV